ARAGRRTADVGRLLHVGGTGGVGAGAGLRRVAHTGGRTALGAGSLEAVGRAGVVRPVAPLVDVARARRRPADVGRLLHVGGAGGTRAGAGLRRVTDAGRRATLDARGLEAVDRTRIVRAVAALVDVARTRCRTADVRVLLHVGGTRDVGARA